MPSQHADEFNHDPWAERYDADVADERDPIRAGYGAVLDWVARQCGDTRHARVLDLGIGTGNLPLRLGGFAALVGVDISTNMLARARAKLAHLENVHLIQGDVLSDWESHGPFDAIASTYTVHHLTEDEKPRLFAKVFSALSPGGVAVFGDLMFADADARARMLEHFRRTGHPDVVEAIEEEFFWYLDRAGKTLTELGFSVATRQFSDLSWGVAAHKPA